MSHMSCFGARSEGEDDVIVISDDDKEDVIVISDDDEDAAPPAAPFTEQQVWDEELAFLRLMHADWAPGPLNAWRATVVGAAMWKVLLGAFQPKFLAGSLLGVKRARYLAPLLHSRDYTGETDAAALMRRFGGEAAVRALGPDMYALVADASPVPDPDDWAPASDRAPAPRQRRPRR